MRTGLVMFALLALLPFVSNTACKFNSTIPCFRNAALLLHTPHILCVFPPSCFLAAPALGDAFYLGDAFFLATLSLGDAFSWRRFPLATPSFLATPALGDTFSWRRLLLVTPSPGEAFSWRPLLLATLSLGDAFSWRRLLSWRRLSPLLTGKR